MRGAVLHDRLVLAVAALFLCAHLAWPLGQLEDIDSFNFALGVRDYDVAAHQPHPPGYPVFIWLAKGAAAVAPAGREALAMSMLAALAGAAALLALYALLRLLVNQSPLPAASVKRATPAFPHDGAPDQSVPRSADRLPIIATLLTAASPLFWVTALRPLSDMPGLAGALGCQYLIVRAARPHAPLRQALIAAVACGVAVGLRSQVAWLVVPLLIWLSLRVWRRSDVRAALSVAATAAAGVLTWAVPMVVITGGVSAYRTALASQAGEDFEGVPMLALAPGVRRLVLAWLDTFVAPWGWWPVAAFVLLCALLGTWALLQWRRPLLWLALGFVPYLAFHLLFQETETTRYALPIVPAIAVLAAAAWVRWTPRLAWPAALLLCVLTLATSVQAHRQYVSAGASVTAALDRMQAAAHESVQRPQVLMHRRVWAETRRARAVLTPVPAFDVLPSPRSHEWHGAVAAWERDAPVWWLVDPRRGDRAAVDPRAMRLRERVTWPMPVAALLGGMRPHAFDWYVASRPQWFVRDGWSLTPELAGHSAAAAQGLPASRATALVRGEGGAVTVLVGGRYVQPAPAEATLAVRIGPSWDAALWQQETRLPAGAFAFTWTLPAGTLPARGYVPLMVGAAGAPDRNSVLLEQFDVQPAGVPVVALESGWYEPERDVISGRTWRWVADQSRLRIAGTDGNVRLVIAGTYPRHYDHAPVLEVLANGQLVGTHTLSRPFRVEQVVTARQLAAGGQLTWRVSQSFVAGERTGSADARRLALEIASLQIDAVR